MNKLPWRYETLSTYYSDQVIGQKAVIFKDLEDKTYYIRYYDETNEVFFLEHYTENSIQYVEDAAENWALGVKKLDITEKNPKK